MNIETAKKMLALIPAQCPIILNGSFGCGKYTMLVSFAEDNNLSMANIDLRETTIDDVIGVETDRVLATPVCWEKDILYFDRLEDINPDVHFALWNIMLSTDPLDNSAGDRYINGKPLRRNQRIIFGLNINDLNSLNFDPVFWSLTHIIKIG
jgi:MoxR-like ATPase